MIDPLRANPRRDGRGLGRAATNRVGLRRSSHVRFTLKNGLTADSAECPLRARNGRE
jgi:hypothetical protein